MTYTLTGEARPLPSVPLTPAVRPRAEALPEEWGYDIQYLVYNARPDEESIRHKLIELGGESIVVGRAGPVTKVHVHGEDPGPFLSYGASLGHLDDVVVENMTLQTLRRRGEWDEEGGTATTAETDEAADELCSNVVAVAPGEGFARLFKNLGACQVVAGGQTMNPSTEDLLQAVEQVPESQVIILPNNKNIIMAAKQAAELSDREVYVVETRTLPQGVAALFAFNPELGAAENARLMQSMATQVSTIEVTIAVRDANIDGVAVSEGEAIAMLDGHLCCTGSISGVCASASRALFRLVSSTNAISAFSAAALSLASAMARMTVRMVPSTGFITPLYAVFWPCRKPRARAGASNSG
jgi:dihydroxyacetone kinase-like predicted kinase